MDETPYARLGLGEKRLRLTACQRSYSLVGSKNVAEFDQDQRLASPIRVTRPERLSVARSIAFDQQIRQDVRIDDDHDEVSNAAQSRPAAMALSMSPIVSGRRRLSRTGLGALFGAALSDCA